MLKEFIATGKTVDEAIDSACEQLSVSRDNVEFEILELPKKKLFKTTPYKVRVFFEAPDEVKENKNTLDDSKLNSTVEKSWKNHQKTEAKKNRG